MEMTFDQYTSKMFSILETAIYNYEINTLVEAADGEETTEKKESRFANLKAVAGGGTMRVDEIQNGVVIDHIPAGTGQKLYELLGLNQLNCTVALIRNAVSTKTGKKDIIKIDAEFPINLDIVGFVSPDITVNRIVNGEIVEKHHMDLPEKLINVVRCKNPVASLLPSRSWTTNSA